MKKLCAIWLNIFNKKEKGFALILVLVFMVIGVLIILPVITYSTTGINTGEVYTNKAETLYAADAGIEDAKWQIAYDQLSGKFDTYDPHDYNTTWTYSLPQVSGKPQINDKNVNVTINNNWVPRDITAPDTATANSIINNTRLMVTGGAYSATSYNIVITYNPGPGEDLEIDTIGIWLPPGYTYKASSSNLGAEPTTSWYQGGQSVIWSLASVDFTSLPGVNQTDSPMTAKITFNYSPSTTLSSNAAAGSTSIQVASTTGFPGSGKVSLDSESLPITYSGVTANSITGIPASGPGAITKAHNAGASVGLGEKPDAVSWINTCNVSGFSYCWDDTVRVFRITSIGSTYSTTLSSTASIGDTALDVTSTDGFPDSGSLTVINEPAGVTYTGKTSTTFTGIPDSGAGSITLEHLSGEPVANDATSVETYVAKNELRKTGGSLNGDYYATGNSLMRDTNNDGVKESRTNSSAIVAAPNPTGADNGVPDDANVSASYLYWGTWYSLNNGRCTNLFTDSCSRFSTTSPAVTYWNNGSDWNVYNDARFRANGNNHSDTSANRDLTKSSSFAFDLGTYPSTDWVFTLSWEQWYSGTTPGSEDGLDFSISNDGGSTWSNRVPAFRGAGVGSSGYNCTATYQYDIPVTYITSAFKIKFHVVGFNVANQYVNIDNMRINALKPNTGMTFKINKGSGDKIVYFDANGNPATSTYPANKVVSTRTQYLITYSYSTSAAPTFNGFAQSCYRDVTELVKSYAHQPVAPETNYNGHATYSAIGDLGDTGNYQLAHAGWSLVTVFTGPETQGHQLYLYDDFFGSRQNSSGVHIDWDNDGVQGGNIEGFVVPQKIAGEVNAAKVTCFVTEGDNQLTGDYFAMNGTKLWDGKNSTSNSRTSPNNFGNSVSYMSGGYSMYDGVDIDTLGLNPTADPPQYITWDSNILKPGDTSASIDLYTAQDYWFMVYMIISFRSETTIGGSLNYLIRG